jgi:hypothetical protein
MARPTRLGRPRRWPPPLFFKLSAVGLRPIDRHPTHTRPAVQLCAGVVQRPGASGPQTIEGVFCHAERRGPLYAAAALGWPFVFAEPMPQAIGRYTM